MPYSYIQLTKKTPDEKNTMGILLVYHNRSKRIIKQRTPFVITCSKCGSEHDNRYIHSDVKDVVSGLLGAGWKEKERGNVIN